MSSADHLLESLNELIQDETIYTFGDHMSLPELAELTRDEILLNY